MNAWLHNAMNQYRTKYKPFMEQIEQTCKNCGNVFSGTYCNICGQKVITGRLTIKSILKQFVNQVLDLDRGFFFTIWMLLKNPGKVIQDYINGITVKYSHPLKFVIIITSVSALISLWSGYFETTVSQTGEIMNSSAEQTVFREKFMEALKDYINIIALITVPFISLASKIVFRRKKLHYAEHLVFICYAIAQTTLINIVFMFIQPIANLNIIVGFVVMILYLSYVIRSFFRKNIVISFLAAIASVVIGYLLFYAFIMVAMVIFVVAYKLFFGGNLKQLFGITQ